MPNTEKDPEDRAAEMRERMADTAEQHEGNRVTAEPDTAQPTREPTRDREK